MVFLPLQNINTEPFQVPLFVLMITALKLQHGFWVVVLQYLMALERAWILALISLKLQNRKLSILSQYESGGILLLLFLKCWFFFSFGMTWHLGH